MSEFTLHDAYVFVSSEAPAADCFKKIEMAQHIMKIIEIEGVSAQAVWQDDSYWMRKWGW